MEARGWEKLLHFLIPARIEKGSFICLRSVKFTISLKNEIMRAYSWHASQLRFFVLFEIVIIDFLIEIDCWSWPLSIRKLSGIFREVHFLGFLSLHFVKGPVSSIRSFRLAHTICLTRLNGFVLFEGVICGAGLVHFSHLKRRFLVKTNCISYW